MNLLISGRLSSRLLTFIISFFLSISATFASLGDRSDIFQYCLHQCSLQLCNSKPNAIIDSGSHFNTSWYLSLLSWECPDECKYQCMWHTINTLENRRGFAVPQFYGKWPFIRLYGVQEPASAVFSILNGLSHLIMYRRFLKTVPISAPNFVLWNMHGIVNLNAWIWSTVFHTRDTPFTEKLDYFCALSVVIYSFYCVCIRLLRKSLPWARFIVGPSLLAFYLNHIFYLTWIHFDYGYNMKVNIVVGFLNSVTWLLWCYINRNKQHMWKCALSVIIINILLLLELGDFPPLWFIFDAHSLWHLGTIPIPFIWYSFLIDDCVDLNKEFYKKVT